MIIETGADLMRFVRAEGPENTVLRLYDLFDPTVYKNSIKYLRKPPCLDPFEHSLDIKQDTWLSVYLDLKRFYEGKKKQLYEEPLGWLLTINKHNCFRHLNTCQRNTEIFVHYEVEEFKDSIISVSTPLDRLIEEEKRQKLLKIISSMTPKEQKVLKMFWEGISHKGIAVMLETTPLNSRQIYCRAVAKIEKCLQGGEN